MNDSLDNISPGDLEAFNAANMPDYDLPKLLSPVDGGAMHLSGPHQKLEELVRFMCLLLIYTANISHWANWF